MALKPTPFKGMDRREEHGVYLGGSLPQFHQLTQLKLDQVIYFGDNVSSDLVGPSKTGQSCECEWSEWNWRT